MNSLLANFFIITWINISVVAPVYRHHKTAGYSIKNPHRMSREIKMDSFYTSFQARSLADARTASQTLAVSKASRKVGLQGSPLSRLPRKSAT